MKKIHTYTDKCASVLEDIAFHREFQDLKWERTDWKAHDDVKFRILTEEVGEIAKALNDKQGNDCLYEELVQVATCAVAWAEEVKPNIKTNLIKESLKQMKDALFIYTNITKSTISKTLWVEEQKNKTELIFNIFQDKYCKLSSLEETKKNYYYFNNTLIPIIETIGISLLKNKLLELYEYKNPIENDDVKFNIDLLIKTKLSILSSKIFL